MRSKTLYAILASLLEGRALALLRTVKGRCGYEAWRQMVKQQKLEINGILSSKDMVIFSPGQGEQSKELMMIILILYMVIRSIIDLMWLCMACWRCIKRQPKVRKTSRQGTEGTKKQDGVLNDVVCISPFGEKYHKDAACKGLDSARSVSSKAQCKMCWQTKQD